MKWVLRIIQGFFSIAFILAGVKKVTGNEQQVQVFTEAFSYSVEFMYIVGVFEILGAIGLLIGFWKSQFTLLASGGSVLLMAGAVFSHLNAGQSIGVTIPSIILLILGIVIFIGGRTKTLKKEQSYQG
ncbi:DoxX family protein [Domibacillus sp. PGB-M46]|uniref:DoxX family protein n=1 Tax=Domibacillus sp. PGB-M46 TaxID=2910255 RepID=UPI001F5ACDFE|nr:DoxX family protein [Domibacillus sp. PGB-M46]MCI2256471.1 DoxX family protein [Domibacillus sp. PGB-M46]